MSPIDRIDCQNDLATGSMERELEHIRVFKRPHSAKKWDVHVVFVREAQPMHAVLSFDTDSSKRTEMFATLAACMCEDQRSKAGHEPAPPLGEIMSLRSSPSMNKAPRGTKVPWCVERCVREMPLSTVQADMLSY